MDWTDCFDSVSLCGDVSVHMHDHSPKHVLARRTKIFETRSLEPGLAELQGQRWLLIRYKGLEVRGLYTASLRYRVQSMFKPWIRPPATSSSLAHSCKGLLKLESTCR